MTTIRAKDRDTVVQALRAGVVPRTGQQLIQVGRVGEIKALLNDIDRVAAGGTCFRLIIGDYGSGKTFFLGLVRAMAQERKLVTAHADLNPDRRLQASGGQARSLYAELMKNLATRAKPDGNALSGVVEKFVTQAKIDAKALQQTPEDVIRTRFNALTEMAGGYDFAEVIATYCRATEEGNETLKGDVVRWLRGEYSTKTEARKSLDVRNIIDDDSFYDYLKLMGRFVRLAGFSGLLVEMDELVNLYKMNNAQSRNLNYEQILRILNDALQGGAEGIGFLLGGTPEFLFDTRRGLYSYAALQSRLAENSYALKAGVTDFSGPVLKLSSLTPEDFYVLLTKLRHLHACGDPARYLLTDAAIEAFLAHAAKRLGESSFRTPRTTIKSFLDLLAILDQNPSLDWRALVDATEIEADDGAVLEVAVDDDDIATFKV